MPPIRTHLLTCAAAALLPLSASAQIKALAKEGEAVAGVGLITRVDNFSVNNQGKWFLEADTDNANADADQVLVTNGLTLVLAEGGALLAPAGATLSSFDSIELNDLGDASYNHFLDNTVGINDDSGIYFNNVLVIQEGAISGAAGFSAGTPYIGFFETKLNDSNQIVVMASVDDPNVASTVDRAIVLTQVSGAGALLSETVVAKEGDILTGQTEAVTDFGTGPHSLAFNNAGQVMFVADLAGDTLVDGAVYIGTTVVAQEGQPSPVAGRNWRTLSTSTRLDLNENGDWALNGTLDGDTASDLAIVSSTGFVAQEGQPLTSPGLEIYNYTSFGSGPVLIDNEGRTIYYAQFTDPVAATNKGIFRDGELLVRQGVDTVDGVTINLLRGIQDGYKASSNGKYVVFEAELVGGVEGIFLVDGLGSVTSVPGCTPSLSTLTVTAGSPALGDSLTYGFDTTAYPTAVCVYAIALSGLDVGGGCGLTLPGIGGELLLDLSVPLLSTFSLPLFVGSPLSLNVPIPSIGGLLGLELHSQAFFLDGTLSAPNLYDLTNGITVVLGL